jgi:hypothetical protein
MEQLEKDFTTKWMKKSEVDELMSDEVKSSPVSGETL